MPRGELPHVVPPSWLVAKGPESSRLKFQTPQDVVGFAVRTSNQYWLPAFRVGCNMESMDWTLGVPMNKSRNLQDSIRSPGRPPFSLRRSTAKSDSPENTNIAKVIESSV